MIIDLYKVSIVWWFVSDIVP